MSNAPYSFPVPFGSDMLKSAQVIHNFVGESKNYQDIEASLASSGYYQTAAEKKTKPQLDDELNNASPSFAGIVMRWTNQGTYYGMCTRNNNFTNRSQKFRLIIKNNNSVWKWYTRTRRKGLMKYQRARYWDALYHFN